ncbi:MAG: phosphomannomutase [Deltaproteobacteria bacterium HGW-Deltaproteobacteria-19]|jgi:phosphomannomutase/phosphoglucomutase|nr:MAG: phosphomannomutase [Deltaproteobacteria bacterium HGW-Deltaproteobacteria-19]
MNPEVFREYDVRGLVDRDLNPSFVRELGQAVGTFARQRGVRTMTLGRDCRLSSESYAGEITRGLLSTGIDVIDLGMCATPILYYSIRHLETDGGVMVTGSHNPPEFNGFKICVGPDTIYGDDIQELRRIMERGRYTKGEGRVTSRDVSGAYEDHLFGNVTVRKGISIVIDAGNGVAGLFALPLFRRLGCRVSELYCEPDGRFPNHFPDPTVPENLQEMISLLKKEGADLGVAFDGDADRIVAVTDNGRILWGDELLLLFSRFILKERPGAAIIGEVKCSQNLYDDIALHGGRPIMWKAGHSLIKGKMKEEEAVLAGEMSGHMFFADRYFGYDDAIYAAARLLEIVSSTNVSLSSLLADVPKTFTTPEIRVDCPDELKFRVVEEVKARFAGTHKIIDIDGVRIPFADGWGLLRASNTQPVLVLRFEAATEERLREIRSLIEGVLEEVKRTIS